MQLAAIVKIHRIQRSHQYLFTVISYVSIGLTINIT